MNNQQRDTKPQPRQEQSAPKRPVNRFPPCPECGGVVVKNGTCRECTECGWQMCG